MTTNEKIICKLEKMIEFLIKLNVNIDNVEDEISAISEVVRTIEFRIDNIDEPDINLAFRDEFESYRIKNDKIHPESLDEIISYKLDTIFEFLEDFKFKLDKIKRKTGNTLQVSRATEAKFINTAMEFVNLKEENKRRSQLQEQMEMASSTVASLFELGQHFLKWKFLKLITINQVVKVVAYINYALDPHNIKISLL